METLPYRYLCDIEALYTLLERYVFKTHTTVPLVVRKSDVWINVSLTEDIQVTISFNVSKTCKSYSKEKHTLR